MLSDAARQLLALLSCGQPELSILLVDDPAIRKLNHKYRGKRAATDVLSFPSSGSGVDPVPTLPPNGRRVRATTPSPPPVLGDVVISVETALRQARALGVRPAQRMRTLLIHGVLHLLGYDHERSPADARRMFARERELAARLEAPRGLRRTARRKAPLPADPQWPPAAMPVVARSSKAAGAGARRLRRAPAPSRKPRRTR
jgi:probable rRNA maturation factor